MEKNAMACITGLAYTILQLYNFYSSVIPKKYDSQFCRMMSMQITPSLVMQVTPCYGF